VGNPSNLLEVLALTQIFERRVVRHFRAHLSWPGTHPEVARTLQQLIDEEVGHIRWVKDRLDAYAAVHGESVVKEMLDRFQRIDEQVYNELSQYAHCFEQIAGRKKISSDSIEHRLRRVAAESLGREPLEIRLDASLVEMGVDSLDLVVFMMAVEDEFQVEFTREDQKTMRTLSDVAERLRAERRDGRLVG
jgi:acyl carrier protein